MYFVCKMHHTTVHTGSTFHYRGEKKKMVKLSLSMEAHKGSGGVTPLILNLGTRCR
jgi:hypothetical protein